MLIVSGALFVSAAVLISGRQNQTAFDQAIRQIHGEIQQTINDVAVGYFPDTTFRCVAGGTGPSISSAASAGQGSNSGCVFLGKAMQFKLQNTDPEQYAIYSIAGLQQFGQQETQDLFQAKPKAIAPSSAESGLPDITVIGKLQSGLTTNSNTPPLRGMWFTHNGVETTIGAVAFLTSLASYDSGAIKSGTQQVTVYPVAGSALGATQAQGADAINGLDFRDPSRSPPDPNGGVFLCFVSSGTDQSGLITIGGGSRALSVTLKIYRGKTCS